MQPVNEYVSLPMKALYKATGLQYSAALVLASVLYGLAAVTAKMAEMTRSASLIAIALS